MRIESRARRPGTTLLLPLVVLVASLAAGPTPAGATDGRAVWPLEPAPTVDRGFNPPSVPWGSGHRGVDLLGRVGQPVRSALPGTVSFAGTIAGRGVVVVDHGATRTTYEPVEAEVVVGTRVAAGGVVGRLQLALSHCFPRACLHWGLLLGSQYLDPLSLLGPAPVRLLPLLTPWGALAGTPIAAVLR